METGTIVLITILTIVMTGALLYLIYNIITSKLLFKSALKASYKSGFALVGLVFLYTITFALWNSSIMFKDVMINSTDNLVAETNFQQITINSDKEMSGDDPNILINEEKWVTELGPTMEEMYEDSPNRPFDNWKNIEKQILELEELDPYLQLPGEHTDFKNTFYYKEFLDIWMYQNEHYQDNNKQTLPYIEFGYSEVAAMDVVISAKEEGGEDLSGEIIRMNPTDDRPSVSAPIPNFEDNKQIPNELLLKEGKIPNANDPVDGTDEENRVEVGILRSFGEAQDYPIGEEIHLKIESEDFVGSPIEYSNLYGKVTGYVEHSALTFFYSDNLAMLPDMTKETIIAVPYDAFNKMVWNVSSTTHPKYEINVTFTDDIQYLKDGGSVEDFGTKRSEDNQEEFIKTMSSFFKRGINLKFYDEPGNTIQENERALEKSIALKWNDTSNSFSSGIQMIFSWSEMNEKVNRIMNSIFLSINLIFIFMVLRRKVMSQSKQIGTFKAIGYNSRQIASSFTINIFIIVILGGFLSILFAFPLVTGFKNMYIDTTLATEMLSTQVGLSVFLSAIILPLIVISLLVWLFVGLILKKPVTSLLNDTTANKPNFLVRASTTVTRHLSFTTAYATKNGIRALGKSLVTFVSIFFSTTLLLFGILVSGFADKASESTLGLMNYESQSYATNKVAALSEEEIELYGNNYDDDKNSTDYSYDFGVGFDYKTYDENTNPEAYQSDLLDPNIDVWYEVFPDGFDYTNKTNRFEAWQQDILHYMRSTKVFRDKSYIEVLEPDFIKSYANTWSLYASLKENDSTDEEKNLTTQNLKFTTSSSMLWPNQGVEVQEFKNLTLENILYTMSMFIASSFDESGLPNNKIIFDIYQTPEEEKKESLFKSTDAQINKINGVDQKQGDIELESIDLFSGPRNSFENSAFNLTSWHRNDDLNKTLLEYENNDSTVLPVLIDYPTARLMNIKVDDTVQVVFPYPREESEEEPPTLDIVVVGIYETYFPLPWFAISEDADALITYLEEVDMYVTEQENTNYMWYSDSNIISPIKIGIENINNREFKHSKEATNKSYSCISSGNFYAPSFYFVGSGDYTTSTLENKQGNLHPITNMAPCFSMEIPTEYYLAISEEGTNLMNQMLSIFVGFAYMIVFVILLVISNETIQGSKREVSTLKALGYKTRTMSKIVLLGQSLIMMASIFIALPFTVLVMSMITNLLLREVGMFFDLTPVFRDIAIVISVVLVIIVVMYVIGTIVYKYTSSLDSLQRDA